MSSIVTTEYVADSSANWPTKLATIDPANNEAFFVSIYATYYTAIEISYWATVETTFSSTISTTNEPSFESTFEAAFVPAD